MGKFRILPLVAVVSSMLVGCGGSETDSSGGGIKKTAYNFSFYASTTLSEAQITSSVYSNCTIYKTANDANGNPVYTVYTQALDSQTNNDTVIGFYSDENGDRVGDYSAVSNKTLSFNLEDIPDNGFFTFQVVDSYGGAVVKAMSFSKEFLANDTSLKSAKFGINRTSTDATACLKGDNRTIRTDSSTRYDSNEFYPGGAGNFNFYSQIDSVLDSANSRLTTTSSLDAYSDEHTFVVQYTDSSKSEVSQYAFDNWSKNAYNTIEMSLADQVNGFITLNSNMSLASIPVDVISGNYAYRLIERSTDSLYFNHPAALVDETWAFEVTDSELPTSVNWNATYSDSVDTTSGQWNLQIDDASLFAVTDLQDQKPSVSANGIIDLGSSIPLQDESGMQRVAYRTSASDYGAIYQVTHVIYSMLTDQVVVPELYYYSYSNSLTESLKVNDSSSFSLSHLILEDIEDVSSSEFMSQFAVGGAQSLTSEITGLAVSEKQGDTNAVKLKQVKSLMLSRVDN